MPKNLSNTMKSPLFVLAVVLLSTTAMANHIPIKFCLEKKVSWLTRRPVADRVVTLSNCIDNPATCTTGADGCCQVEKRFGYSIDYCNGEAKKLCSWSVSKKAGDGDYHPDHSTLVRKVPISRYWFYYDPVTPKEYSCCACDGKSKCAHTIYGDAKDAQCPTGSDPMPTSSASGPFTVTFTTN